MNSLKKIIATVLCALTVVLCLAGCSKATEATEITSETMLIAYTEENAPFVYTGEDGKLTGFDVELFRTIFNDIKNDYKNYEFVKVDEGYRLGEDAAYTNEKGEKFVAYVMIGGLQKDVGTNNEDYTMSDCVITNSIITVTNDKSSVQDYASFKGAKVGVVSEAAAAALDKNTTIKRACKAVKEYKDINTALADLDAGKLSAVITDEFSFCPLKAEGYKVLNGTLDKVDYFYGFKKWDWYNEAINNAIFELKSPEYKDADEFTPIVEKYFGYNASSFSYEPSDKK